VTKKGILLTGYSYGTSSQPTEMGVWARRVADAIPNSSMRIAVLEEQALSRSFVCNAIRAMRHEVAEFIQAADLVSALSFGAEVDIVIAAFRGDQDAALSGARILRQAAGSPLPVLLMMRSDQLRSADVFVMDRAIDFVMLPCEEREIVARLATSIQASKVLKTLKKLVFGDYRFEPRSRTVFVSGEPVKLKPKEFDLALFLFQNAGSVQTREKIFAFVWRSGELKTTRTLDVHIANIRRKLKLSPEGKAQLSVIYRLGYLLTLSGFQEHQVMQPEDCILL
jgi:DNA-binding response OmpR family regulator